MIKLGKKNQTLENVETVEAYAGHLVDCSGVEVCDCNATRERYEENNRLWRHIAW